jgi:hypothetical protein
MTSGVDAGPVTVPPRAVFRLGVPLLDWQLWCFGRDVCTGGNLLLETGFVRHRASCGGAAGTAYQRPIGRDRVLTVWGFGVHLGDAVSGAGVFVRRHAFLPRLGPARLALPIGRPCDMPAFAVPRDAAAWSRARTLMGALCTALADYERDVARRVDSTHRQRCLLERPRRIQRQLPIPVEATADAWRRLAEAFGTDACSLPATTIRAA